MKYSFKQLNLVIPHALNILYKIKHTNITNIYDLYKCIINNSNYYYNLNNILYSDDSMLLNNIINKNIHLIINYNIESNLQTGITDFENIYQTVYNYELYIINKFKNINKNKICNFSIEYINLKFLNEQIKLQPKSYFIYSDNISYLINYYNLGCWVCFLTYNYYSFRENDNYCILTNNINMELIKNNKLDYNHNIFIFQAISIYQNIFYYDIIIDINNKSLDIIANYNRLLNYFVINNTITCLKFFRIFPKDSDFNKTNFVISSNQILYKTFFNENELKNFIYNNYNLVSLRITDYQDIIQYKELFNDIIKYSKYFNIKINEELFIIYKFMYRKTMNEALKDFILHINKYNDKLVINSKYILDSPNSFILDGKYINDSFNLNNNVSNNNVCKFKEYLDSLYMRYPFIVKYNSDNIEDNHMLTIVYNNSGLTSFLKHIENNLSYNLVCLFQKFINHNGFYIKTFYINKQVYIFTRRSFPNIIINNIDMSFKDFNGFINTKTKNISSLFNKNNDCVDNDNILLISNELKDYITNIILSFVNYFDINLISIDLILEQDSNKLYILDCNYYPAFKELKSELSYLLNSHHINIYKDLNAN